MPGHYKPKSKPKTKIETKPKGKIKINPKKRKR